jgi:signal transduction histidine kinase
MSLSSSVLGLSPVLSCAIASVVMAGVLYVQVRLRMRGSSAVAMALGVGFLGIALGCAANSARWIGGTFPGFLVLPNRVIAAAGLSGWSGVEAGDIYHHEVIAVNGRRVSSAEEVYALVRAEPPGTPLEYVLGAGEARSYRVIPSMSFDAGDYGWLFGLYLFNGVLFAAAGLVVWTLKPHTDGSWAMLALGSAIGTFALTATDLYGPQWFYRLHLAAEAFLPATLIHLAAVFPKNYIRGRRWWALLAPYGVASALALAHQWCHFTPARYSLIYNLCSAYLGAGALTLIVAVAYTYRTSRSQLVRQRVRVLLVGTITAAGPAALLMGASGLSGGSVPVNAAAITAFVFPLTLGYGIVKHDLFAIDRMVKRATYYLVLSGTVFVVYMLVIGVLDLTVHRDDFVGSLVYALALSLAVVLLFEPVKARARTFVDRVCFRRVYDPKKVLQATSQALASTPYLAGVLDVLLGTVRRELQVEHASVYLHEDGDRGLTLARRSGSTRSELPETIGGADPVVQAVADHPRALSVYDLPAQRAADEAPDLFGILDADLLLPLRFQDDFVGIVVLGSKQSGAFYTAADVDFLGTLAAQSVVSILHAMAYRRIDDLNRDLERKVAQRTGELATANGELLQSLQERERAYVELQRKQEQLLHAEKMAALGRLTAGIAHEISTPLGAALSTLKVAEDLVQEYRTAIDEPTTRPEDHREMASELAEVSAEAREWTQKAARFVRSIKLYGLGREELREHEFRVSEVIEETCQLLAHRVRLCECHVTVSVDPATPPLFGDAGRLGQVIANLVTNAVDAYRDGGQGGGEVRVVAGLDGGEVAIRVSDDGCGIPAEHVPRVFEELFTTKPPGLGTGLGLPISRSIVADCFGGTMEVASEPGRGSTFTVRLPLRRPRLDFDAGEAAPPPDAAGLH